MAYVFLKNKFLIFLSLGAFIFGTLYLIFTQDWIIFRYPSYKKEAAQTAQSLRARKQKVQLIFWHNKKWNNEAVEILATDDAAYTIEHLVNSWLTLLDEDQVMAKKVTLQSALLSPNNQLYLSFDRNPFDMQNSTKEKWMWVEGLLKTIRENKIPVQSIHFLVHHQIMDDYHLDFSRPWPLSGFYNLYNH